jgi:hypothetical protein
LKVKLYLQAEARGCPIVTQHQTQVKQDARP